MKRNDEFFCFFFSIVNYYPRLPSVEPTDDVLYKRLPISFKKKNPRQIFFENLFLDCSSPSNLVASFFLPHLTAPPSRRSLFDFYINFFFFFLSHLTAYESQRASILFRPQPTLGIIDRLRNEHV